MGLDRRGFISFLVGGAAGTLFTPVPWKLLDDVSIWTQNWPWIPRVPKGANLEYGTTCKLCPAGCPLSVNTVGGKPTAAAGKKSQATGGAICPLGASAVQLLYSPARAKGPLVRENGKFKSLSWKEAQSLLQEKIAAAGTEVAAIDGDENGTGSEVLSAFLSAVGSDDYYNAPGDSVTARRTWAKMNGQGQIGFDVENSDYVLMAGADALSSWGPVVRNQNAFAGRNGKWVYAGPMQSGSGAAADKWFAVRPGKEATLLMGVAYYILREGNTLANIEGFQDARQYILSNYKPSKVAEICGVNPEVLKEIARDLQAAYAPVVVFGSGFGQGAGQFDAVAGIFVNLLLGRMNKSGGMVSLPDAPAVIDGAPGKDELAKNDFVDFVTKLKRGAKQTKVLLVNDANPFYSCPQTAEAAEALSKVPFKVSFSSFMDETAAQCDLILPAPLFLERYDDAFTPYGSAKSSYSICSPVINPIFDTKPMPDILLETAGKMNIDLGFRSFKDVLQAKAEKFGSTLRKLENGKVLADSKRVFQDNLRIPASLLAGGLQKQNADYPLALAPFFRMHIGTARMATTPFGVLTIRDDNLDGQHSFVHVNSVTAKKLRLAQGDKVKVQSGRSEVAALLNITE
ncbi:MAG: menaquinone reductase molybdopterin-binding-like subunit QrcB, partial [Thermodesulfobacteriota bacterium]